MTTVFRPYSSSDALRSDRSAGDRQRHREKVRESIRSNIADLVAEESIIGKSKDKVVRVPIRGIREYRFVYGENSPGVSQGDGNAERGQVVGKRQKAGQGMGQAGDQPGVDYYETDITLEEVIEMMFEDLELPALERKALRQVISEHASKRKGYRRAGVRAHLDKKRTVMSRIRRRLATGHEADEETPENQPLHDPDHAPELIPEAGRFPFHKDDLRYHRQMPDVRMESNAVVICIMDTSGSMDTMKKYLARSFFFLLYQFVSSKYRNVEIVFIAHHTAAREVTEEEFFHKGESGGTIISSGYKKAMEIINERYHPSLWNLYAFHCSDGDNFESDNLEALKTAKALCEICNLFGYGEIKPAGSGHYYEGSMLKVFRLLKAGNFQSLLIERKEDVWPSFKTLLSRERVEEGD